MFFNFIPFEIQVEALPEIVSAEYSFDGNVTTTILYFWQLAPKLVEQYWKSCPLLTVAIRWLLVSMMVSVNVDLPPSERLIDCLVAWPSESVNGCMMSATAGDPYIELGSTGM